MQTQRISDFSEENNEVERLAIPDNRFILNYSKDSMVLAQNGQRLMEQNRESRKRICICVDI